MVRPRACGALFAEGKVLVVQHRTDGREFWTLPGGAIEPGESSADAAIREMWEETGLRTQAVLLLFERPYSHRTGTSTEYCYLMSADVDDATAINSAKRGIDPEQVHLTADQRELRGLAWFPVTEMKHDLQVAMVLAALAGIELNEEPAEALPSC